jgi:hypothetical protein
VEVPVSETATLTQALIHSLRVDQNLLLDFFIGFSRFECALNAQEFVWPGTANVNWSVFTTWLESLPPSELEPVLLEGRELSKQPPKKLVRGPEGLDWESVSQTAGESDIRFLIGCLTRARNNLFHGGKYVTLPEPVDRNQWVIKNALRVLYALAQIPTAIGIRRVFQEDLP